MTRRSFRTCWFSIIILLWLFSTATASWLPEARLTVAADESYLSGNNAGRFVTDASGIMHLVWYDSRDGDAEIYYRRLDGGVWGNEVTLTSNSARSEDPAIAAGPSGDLHLVWVDYSASSPEVYHKYFDGISWSAATAVSDGPTVCEEPSVAVDSLGVVHVVWRDYTDGSWSIIYSAFDGVEWSEGLTIADPAGYSRHPSITCDDSMHVHVAWNGYVDLNWEIYYRRLDEAGWGPEVRLTADTGLSENPTILADSNANIQIFWDDNRGGNFAIYQKTFDGNAWSADIAVTGGVNDALSPSAVAADDSVLHVVWYANPGLYSEIYGMTFDGAAWGPEERISDANGESENPAVALDDDGTVNVVWHDGRHIAGPYSPDNFEIYWRVRTTLPKPELISTEPDSGMAYTVVAITDLAGTGFFGQVQAWLQMEGEADIQAVNEVVESATRVSCEFDLWDAPAGLWDVVVENLDLQRDTLFAGFRVVPLPPLEVTSIEPHTENAYVEIHITNLAGNRFVDRATVWLEKAGQDDIHATGVIVESPTGITCDFDLTGAEPGDWNVVVQNPDGYSDTLPGGFTVLPSPWGDDLRLTDDDAVSSLSQSNARSIAVDSQGHLHVVWNDTRDGNREIYYKAFDGAAWSADLRLTVDGLHSTDPGIAVDGNDNLHVVWNDDRDGNYEIYYKRFDGASWGTDTRLTSAGGDSRYPSIAVDGLNRILVVWQDKRGGEGTKNIYMRMHDGITWQAEENIASDVPGSQTPAIAVDANNHVHVAWRQNYGDSLRTYYKMFNGSAWGEEEVLAAGESQWDPPNPPTITTDHLNQVHVAWDDDPDGSYEVFYRLFDGITWYPRERVSGELHNSSKASIVVDNGGSVHMIWVDRQDGNNEIYYAGKKGLYWEQETRLTKAPDESIYPSLAIAPDGALHMVWRDLRDGNYEIYYKTGASWTLASIEDRAADHGQIGNLRCAPNPVRLSTGRSARIEFTLGFKARPVLSVYDVSGRLVRRIEAEELEPGHQSIAWDGTAISGGRVAEGIYFLEVSAAGHKASAKVIMLR